MTLLKVETAYKHNSTLRKHILLFVFVFVHTAICK